MVVVVVVMVVVLVVVVVIAAVEVVVVVVVVVVVILVMVSVAIVGVGVGAIVEAAVAAVLPPKDVPPTFGREIPPNGTRPTNDAEKSNQHFTPMERR